MRQQSAKRLMADDIALGPCIDWTQRRKPARMVHVAAGLGQLMADDKWQVRVWEHVQQKRADYAQIASTIDSAENEKTYENRSTVKRHARR